MNSDASPLNVLDQLAKRARRMYTLPAVAMQVVELTNRPTIDVVALKECIQNDPALTTKILRVANSSLFGLPSKVRDLNQALTLIGSTRLKLMVLGFSLPDELLSNLDLDVLKNYWRHALVKAVAAREISEMVWKMPGDEAFIAGLLQDVGMLALIQDLGRPYVAFLDRVWSGGGDLAALESSTLGFDHVILSARLLEAWG
ncbi:MAG: HDOD domain-containing protein, partial [Pirellulaceae bacterium]|nr:HDOD domain-containing protein [Pirellulaceae bacterium]